MNKLLAVVVAVWLTLAVEFVSSKEIQRYRRNTGQGKKNIGCELSYPISSVIKTEVLAYYSQLLIRSTYDDVNRLANKLIEFLSNCCLDGAEAGCFKGKADIFLDRICADEASKQKHKETGTCCKKYGSERTNCFKNLQSNPPMKLPPIDDYGVEQECLAYMANTGSFVEKYLHGFAKRTTRFPATVVTKIAYHYVKTYAKCCNKEEYTDCFTIEKKLFMEKLGDTIKKEDKICQEYKTTGEGLTLIWALVFHAKMSPKSSLTKALSFARDYKAFAAQCCSEEFTSDCFQEETDVLFQRFCATPVTPLYETCCKKEKSDMAECIGEMAILTSGDMPALAISAPEVFCEQHKEENKAFIIWFTHEYARRNRGKNLKSVVEASTKFLTVVKNCCSNNGIKRCFEQQMPNVMT
ncbi:albumin-like [Latimeria chalumnae]|uniref:albumin-like n=1 Tax=Latimeria chalumnae TaxID=7897 RepID=UPI0003C11130|nr:PREDICTED: serum albumin-like [Latimeria chalumnae]|eukprot:XP_006011459.1 PREDICTED: serum albumin-like [Latimeria chalumnae]